MPFEIWRHRPSGVRYLVVVRDGIVAVAAGPLAPGDDPRRVLEHRANQNHNARALLDLRAAPGEYAREYTRTPDGHAVALPDADERSGSAAAGPAGDAPSGSGRSRALDRTPE